MGNILRQTVHAVAQGFRDACTSFGQVFSGVPLSHILGGGNTQVSFIPPNYPSGGWGQLREGDLRSAAEAQLLAGRSANRLRNVGEAFPPGGFQGLCAPFHIQGQQLQGFGRMISKTAQARKDTPVATGVMDYFPDALKAVARVSFVGNEQHNPGSKLHWDRSKSQDEADSLMRHFLERGTMDSDGLRHSAKLAWRALALLQKEIEGDKHNET